MSNDKRFYKKIAGLNIWIFSNGYRVVFSEIRSLLFALSSMLYALCSTLYALRSLLFAPRPFLSALRSMLLAFCSLLFALCLPFGCSSVKEHITSGGISDGQVIIYLKGTEKVSTDITFEIQSIQIVSENNEPKEVSSKPLKINSISLSNKQIILGEVNIPQGRYKKLQFKIKDAILKKEGRTASLSIPSEWLTLDIDLNVIRNQSSPLFLTWNSDNSIRDGFQFNPIFSLKTQSPELSSLLIYVTNEDSNNVSVINRQTDDVVANIMVGKKPRGIAVSQIREKPRVYVVNSVSGSVSVINPTTHKVETEIPLRFGNSPESITVAKISPERELLFIANYGSDNVSVVDSATYQEIDKINTGNNPVYIVADPPLDILQQTRFLSFEDFNSLRNYRDKYFNVYVANKNSKDVTLIKMDSQKLKPEKIFLLPVQWSPVTLAVDYQRGKVYVGNYNYDNLSVIDIVLIAKGYESGVVSEIANVGTKVTGIIPDPDIDRFYLLKEYPSEITVIRPFSEAFSAARTTVSPVIANIQVGTSPKSFIMDPEGRKIYTVNRGDDSVTVVDKTTISEEKVIPVGKNPYGIAMFPY